MREQWFVDIAGAETKKVEQVDDLHDVLDNVQGAAI